MRSKKALAAVLATTMIMSMGTTALAATNTGGDTSFDVSGTYVAPTPSINVDITWGSMAFTYDDNQAADSKWSCETDTNKIHVANSSDVRIDAAVAFTGSDTDATGVTTKIEGGIYNAATAGTVITDGKLSLAKKVTTATTADAYLQITGGAINASDTTLGNVKVTITAPTNNITFESYGVTYEIIPATTFDELANCSLSWSTAAFRDDKGLPSGFTGNIVCYHSSSSGNLQAAVMDNGVYQEEETLHPADSLRSGRDYYYMKEVQ